MSEPLIRAVSCCRSVADGVYFSGSGLEVLAVQRVSKAQAWQRAGRAGREDSGSCYRLYTEEEFDSLVPMTVPEIQRCLLENFARAQI